MKIRIKIWLPVVVALLDAGAVVIGAWLAYLIRFSETVTGYFPTVTMLPPLDWYLKLSLVLAGLTLISLLVGGLYIFPRRESLFDELVSVSKHYIIVYTLVLAGIFFYREVSFSRMTMALLFIFSGGFLGLVRIIGRWLREELYAQGIAVKRAAVVGSGEQAGPIVKHLSRHPEFGVKLIGNISFGGETEEELTLLGNIGNADRIVEEHKIDTMIIAPAADDTEALPRLVRACYGINVDFLYLPEISPANGHLKKVVEVGGVPFWTLKDNPFEGWLGVVKRASDILASSFLFLITLPLIIVVSIAVKLSSPGPLLYRQRRIGLDGREFDCLKFRSMRIDAERETGPVWATRDDERATRVGKILRRWSLDELPQFWNVLRGDMSMVGPRPERPEFVKQFEKRIDGYHERHRVRAGLTGWAQVNGHRGDTPIEARTDFDRYYVENWSPLFDLKIILMTGKAILKGENSY